MNKKTNRFLSLLLVFSLMFTGINLAFVPKASAAVGKEYYVANGTYVTQIGVAMDGDWFSPNNCKKELTNAGYTVLDKDLNDGAGGQFIYMGYKMSSDRSKAIRRIHFTNNITTNPLSYGGANYVPLQVSDLEGGALIDLNKGAGGKTIYTFYSTSENAGAPITALAVNTTQNDSNYTYTGLWIASDSNDLPIGEAANLNAKKNNGSMGDKIFLHYNVAPSVDTSALRTAISTANTYISNSSRYVSVAALTTARNSGTTITNDYDNNYGISSTYSQAAIDAATSDINDALNALQTTVKLDSKTNGGAENTQSFNVTIGTNTQTTANLSGYTASKSGWNFLGWNADKTATSGITSTVTTYFNSIFYAIFSKSLTAVFNYKNADNTAASSSQSVTVYNNAASGSVTSPVSEPNVSYGGSTWSFLGWRADTSAAAPTANGGSSLSLASSGSTYNYYAVYSSNVTVNYNANGGQNAPANGTLNRYYGINGNVSDFSVASGIPTRIGYSFLGWSTSAGSNTVDYSSGAVISGYAAPTLNLYAVWTADTYTITFNSDGGSACGNISYNIESTSLALQSSVKTGFIFAGWKVTSGAGNWNVNDKLTDSILEKYGNITATAQWTPTNDLLAPDVKVMDFCLATKFSGFTSNDTFLNEYIKDGGYTVTVVGLGNALSESLNALDSSYKNNRIASNGIFELTSDGCIVYSPDKAMPVSNQRDSIYYALKVSNSSETFYLYTKLTVIPGTSIYYEDSMPEYITYTNGTVAAGADATGVWKTTGVPQSMSAALDAAADVVGQSVYASSTTFSLGSAHEVTVSANNNEKKGGSWPNATFTFVGTGFDLISVMSYNSGAAEVEVFKDTDPIDKPSYDWVVDTYYEYTYTGEKWQPSDGTNSLYQIPVIGRTDLEYGTYTVKVIPTYSSRLDHQKNGSYEFYIDAVRVYNPLQNDSEANSAYAATGDYIISNEAIRDMLISSAQLAAAPTTGSVFISVNSTDASVADYTSTGAKNEVYLKKDQGLAFSVSASQKPSKVQISAHAISTGAQLRFGNGNGSYSAAVPITSGTTLFYTIPSNLLSWTYSDGQYVSSEIVIQSTGTGVLSLCNLKCSSDAVPPQAAPASVMFMMSSPFATRAAATAFTMANLPKDANALFVPENVETQEITETVVSGSDVKITTTTSADVERLTINGKDATCSGVNEDGTKTWTYTYTTAKSSGTEKLEITAYDSMGVASESTETTVTTETKYEMFFEKLLRIFKMIFEYVNNIVDIAHS